MASSILPEPRMQIVSRIENKVYCDICERSWLKKNNKLRKYVTGIDQDKFKGRAFEWKAYEHKFKDVYDKVDWSRGNFFVCGTCRRTFFDDNVKNACQYQIEPSTSSNTSHITISDETDDLKTEDGNSFCRRSSRKRQSYEAKRDVNMECVICKSVKKDKKGRILPVTIITLRDVCDPSKAHIAERTLEQFSRIHIKHNTIFKDAAERILLISGTKSLFAADVGYHKKQCYALFRHKKYLRLDEPKVFSSQTTLDQTAIHALFELVRLHIVQRQEVYALADLRKAYESLMTNDSPSLRSCDIKERLLKEFPNDISISCTILASKENEFVFPTRLTLTKDILDSASNGFGLSKSVVLHSAAHRLHQELKSRQKKRNWPPTPQDILEDNDSFDMDTFNLIAWIVNPKAQIGDNGFVSLRSKRKEKKIAQICRNIESLLPDAQPSLDQVLLSLRLHWKTGAREPVDIINSFGYGISYKETLFIEDKWAEWDRAQNSNIPSNICKQKVTTVVADNIDWKNKNNSGQETHNTNIILIQHTTAKNESKVSLKPDYAFIRKNHRSFKAVDQEESFFNCRKVNPQKFDFNESLNSIDLEYVIASKKTIA